MFADKCLKMNLLIDICIVFCRIKKNSQVSIYSLAVLNIGHCVELSFLKGKLGGIFVVKVYQSDYKLKTIPICGESTLTFTSKWNKFTKLHFKKVHIKNLPNLPSWSRKVNSSQHSIKSGCILVALMKNLHLFVQLFGGGGWRNLKLSWKTVDSDWLRDIW